MKVKDRNWMQDVMQFCRETQQNYFIQWKEQKETYSVQGKRAFNLKSPQISLHSKRSVLSQTTEAA